MTQYFVDPRSGRTYSVGGDDAIVGGYGRQMIVGRDGMFVGADGGALAAEAAAARAAGGFVVQDKTVAPAPFYQILPFSRDYTAGESFPIALYPQRTFRVDNLVVTSPEGPYFELSKWSVGQDNMFVADGSVNCAAFSEGAAQRGLELRGFTANQGAQIVLGFTNTDTEEGHRVSGMLSGPAIMKLG